MRKVMLSMCGGIGALVVLFGAVALFNASMLQAVQADAEEAAEPAPPEGQTYTGSKECAACHFKQFMTWKKDKHSKTFDLLPAEYQTNADCVKCHSTGFGKETGFKDMATTPTLAGTTCEACHGPGSKHAEIAQGFGKKKLTAEEEQTVRDAIWKVLPKNICITCHVTKGHHPSLTPKELQKK